MFAPIVWACVVCLLLMPHGMCIRGALLACCCVALTRACGVKSHGVLWVLQALHGSCVCALREMPTQS
jgi:hypothetical protein